MSLRFSAQVVSISLRYSSTRLVYITHVLSNISLLCSLWLHLQESDLQIILCLMIFVTCGVKAKVQESLVFDSVSCGSRLPGVQSLVSLPIYRMVGQMHNLSVSFFLHL